MANSAQTLDELKAENATEVEKPTAEDGHDTPTGDEANLTASESEEDTSGDAPGVTTQGDESEESSDDPTPEQEPWLSDDEEPKGNAKPITHQDIAAAKRHQKAKLERRHQTELDELRAENEALKRSSAPLQAQAAPAPPKDTLPPKPVLSDYDHDDARYESAVDDWINKKIDLKVNSTVTQAQQETQRATYEYHAKQALERSVEAHYTRAADMANKHSISAEVYKEADLSFRNAIETVYPGKGDALADEFIANMDEGSEKVVFYLTRKQNAGALSTFQSHLMSDHRGLKPLAFLSKLNGEVAAQSKTTTSRAPVPVKQIKGNAAVPNKTVNKLYQEYEKAAKANNGQARINIRMKAKEQGIDVSSWTI